MSSGTIESAFEARSSGPYQKALKVKIVAVDEPYEYKSKNGQTMKGLVAAASDGKEVAKVLCYDQNKFKFLKVGQTVVVRDVIRRQDDGVRALVVTSVTKAFMAAPLEVPFEHTSEGQQIVNPSPAEVVSVKEALASPPRKKVSLTAKIIQEDEQKTVPVRGDTVPIKTITVEDASGQSKVTLWRDCSTTAARPGDFVLVTDVVANSYNNNTSLSITGRSKVKICEQPKTKKQVVVEGVCVDGGDAELLLADETCLTVRSEMLMTALCTEDQPMIDLEMATCAGPFKLEVVSRGGETLSILKC